MNKQIIVDKLLNENNGSYKDLAEDAYDAGYQAALQEHAANKEGWVRVEDRLPIKYDVDRNGSVWAWNNKLGFGAKVNPCFISIGSDYSHWMTIPNKPTN